MHSGGYMTLHFAVSKDNQEPKREDFKTLSKSTKALGSALVSGYHLSFDIKAPGIGPKINTRVEEALIAASDFLAENGYQNTDEVSGQVSQTSVYQLSNRLLLTTEANFEQFSSQLLAEKNEMVNEIIGLGLVGAFVGSLIGAISIVIIGQLGFVAAISGIIMGICTVKGYELLAKKLSFKGIVISIIMMIIMTYIGHKTSFAISVANYYKVGFFRAFQSISQLIKEGYIKGNVYYAELFKVYIFTAIGAIPTIINSYRNNKMKYDARQLSDK
ncbi:hypothetical protein HMPREF9318_00388 [Streptococcus urinalis FB127-CNA-2]|nr:hypothetical protein HMPREF9318_00388 [Streptococcus urinalis FB127-CNA-2]VEF32002.1 Uncharacterised protein [Streptococcus urinalis]